MTRHTKECTEARFRAWAFNQPPLPPCHCEQPSAQELEAVRILRSQLSGPSARFDAERLLADLGWPALAIRLAKGEDIGPAGGAT